MSEKGFEKSSKGKQKRTKPRRKRKWILFVFCVVFSLPLVGVVHFYTVEKRLPKSLEDFQVIGKNLFTLFLFTTEVVQEKWESLRLEQRARDLASRFRALLERGEKESRKETSQSSGVSSPGSSHVPSWEKAYREHVKKSEASFSEGKKLLEEFRKTRDGEKLEKAQKKFLESKEELEKAKTLLEKEKQSPELIQEIERQIEEVNQFLHDCVKLGSF